VEKAQKVEGEEVFIICEKGHSYKGGVLISAVAQAIPTYIMLWFLFSKSLCDYMEKMIRWFGYDIL
jgi:hypothetical protein